MSGDYQAFSVAPRSRAILLGLYATAAAVALLAPALAFADTEPSNTTETNPGAATLPEVTVTARRVEEDIQKVPLTVTAIDPEQLKQQDITDVYDLTAAAPSLNVSTEFTSLLPNFAIRGLSTGVATYFADAPTAEGPLASESFMDISQVQVLNGPQGTLFGRSSASGAVLIDPVHPNLDSWGGLVDGIVGDYGRLQGTAVANLPLIPGELALRVAVNANHVDGYTHVIGSSQTLDGVNNQQVRVGLEFKKGGFDNYLVASYVNVNQSATADVLTAANTNPADLSGLFLLPSILGAATGPDVFGSVCATAVAKGFASNVGACESQRAALLGAIAPAFEAELARVSAGGSAIRSVPGAYNGAPQFAREQHGWVVDVAQYDFGAIGPVKLSVKNIFSFDSFTDNIGGTTTDGIGGRAELSTAFTSGPLQSVLGSDNYVGTTIEEGLSPPILTYTNDFQVHANVADNLLTSVVGVFYTDEAIPTDLAGVSNLYQVFGGSTNVDLGDNAASGFSAGGYGRETAVYTQETLDLSKWVHGLSLTGGYRFSWDSGQIKMFAAVPNYDLPTFVPGTPGTFVPGALSTSGTSSSGYNYTFQAAEQVNPDWMIYGSVNRAYVPGGVNLLGQTAAGLPNYTPTFQPEIVLEEEIGTKFNLDMGGFRGRIGADFYNNNFTNIVETLYGFISGSSTAYNENIAAAYLRGVEVYGTLIPTPEWELRFSYNYNDAHYTKWIGSDPYNVAQAGDPVCLPTSPTGLCYLNLANNPFALMPSQQAHLTLVYHAPIPPNWGRLSMSATAYGQTREYYEAAAYRDLQVFPAGLNGVSQAPYATLNLRADWDNAAGSGFDVGFFVNNATNVIYTTGKFPQLETLGFAIANYAPPVMFGFEVSRKFGP